MVSLARFTLITVTTVSNRGKYFVIRGPVLVYGKTMVIAVIPARPAITRPLLQPRNPPRRFQTTGQRSVKIGIGINNNRFEDSQIGGWKMDRFYDRSFFFHLFFQEGKKCLNKFELSFLLIFLFFCFEDKYRG